MQHVNADLLRPYEVVVLLHPDTPLEEQKEIFRRNKTTLATFKGKFHTLETWGKRNLANPINKLRKAHYFHATFEANPQAIAEIERIMRINEKVLRFMHTRLDERLPLTKHTEIFRKGLLESATREREREAKAQARRNAAQAASQNRHSDGM